MSDLWQVSRRAHNDIFFSRLSNSHHSNHSHILRPLRPHLPLFDVSSHIRLLHHHGHHQGGGTFVVLCILTSFTEKLDKPLYSTRPYYLVLMLNLLLLTLILLDAFVFHVLHNIVLLSVLLEVLIYILFVFLPPLVPIMRRLSHKDRHQPYTTAITKSRQ